MTTLAEIAEGLRSRIEDVARTLLGEPNAMSTKDQLRFGNKGSLSIEITGEKQGQWFDHEAQQGGGPLDLVEREHNGHGMEWARDFLGVRDDKADKVGEIRKRTKPLAGTIGEKYLRNRGITKLLPDETVRFDPRGTPPGAHGAVAFFAMDHAGRIGAVQRVYVIADGKKAPVFPVKRSNGRMKGHAVKFPGEGPVVLAEGPETALSVWQATGRETWAVCGGGFSAAPVNAGERVIIARDNDPLDAAATQRLQREAQKLRLGGCDVVIVDPPIGKDFNDTLREGGEEPIRQAFEDALARAAVVAKAAPPSQEAAGTGVPPSEEEAPNLTETGNALRFVRRSRGHVVWIAAWNAWLLYDGKRWCQDATLRAPALMAETCRALYEEAGAKEEKEERKAVSAWAIKSESRKIQGNALDLAKHHVALDTDVFDQNQWQLNVQNGTLNLRNGQLRPHAAADMITKLAPVEYLPTAKCPLWEKFLAHVLGGDSELIAWVQRFVGYSLTGDTTEHVFALLHGSGRNGKSTFLETLRAMLGDYATLTDFRTLAHRDEGRGGDARPDLMALRGARLVTASESGEGRRLGEDLIKKITGGDAITARQLHQAQTTFHATFKLTLATNHKPIIRGNDLAIWERVKLVPFEVTIPRDSRDKDLGKKLLAELPGILAWAVRGCLEWQSVGLGEAQKIEAATQGYREEQDFVGQFIDEQCWVGQDYQQPAGDLLKTYNEWAVRNGAPTLKSKDFGGRLTARGFLSGTKRIGGAVNRIWTGLALRADPAGDVL